MHFQFAERMYLLLVDIDGLKQDDKILAFHSYEKTDLAMKKDG